MLKMSGSDFCIRSVAPKYIRSTRAANGSAGILVHDKAGEALPFLDLSTAVDDRFLGVDKAKGGFRKDMAIQSN